MAKYNEICIPILRKGASAKSSDCSSHAVKSHKAQLAVLRGEAASWHEIFHYKKWNLADGGEYSVGSLVEAEKILGLILDFSYSQVLDQAKREMHPEANQKKRSLMKKTKRRKTTDLCFSHMNERRKEMMKGRRREGARRARSGGPRGARP